jgi:hypothetical protein
MPRSDDTSSEIAFANAAAATNSALEQKIDNMTKVIADLATKVLNLSLHVIEIEDHTVHIVSPISNPLGCPCGLPGYGGISELPATSATAPPFAFAAPPLSTAPPPSKSLPIHQISMPHSPSPLSSFPPHIQPQQPSHYRAYTSPHTNGLGVSRYHNLEFPTFDGKEDPLVWLNRYEQFFWSQ